MRGFTLAEILVVVVIFGLVGALLVQTLIQNNSIFYQQSARVSEGISLNNATKQLSLDIKSASSIAPGYPEAGPFQYTSTTDSLVLKIPSIDPSGNVIDSTFDYIIIYKDQTDPKKLKRQFIHTPPSTRTDSDKVLLDNLQDLTFSYFDQNDLVTTPAFASKINFNLNVFTQLGANSQTSNSSVEIILRNN